MSKSVKKVGKAVGSVASKAVKSVGNVTKPVTSAVGKIADGKISEGLGDIGQTGARMGLDIATAGNRDKADALTGGALTSAELAARGNSKDIARVGVTGAAAVVGGPAAAMAVNGVLAQGGNILQAGGAAFGVPTQITDIAGNILHMNGPTASPSPVPIAPSEMNYGSSNSYSGGSSFGGGSSNNTLLIIGAAFGGLLLIIVLFLGMRKR